MRYLIIHVHIFIPSILEIVNYYAEHFVNAGFNLGSISEDFGPIL